MNGSPIPIRKHPGDDRYFRLLILTGAYYILLLTQNAKRRRNLTFAQIAPWGAASCRLRSLSGCIKGGAVR